MALPIPITGIFPIPLATEEPVFLEVMEVVLLISGITTDLVEHSLTSHCN